MGPSSFTHPRLGALAAGAVSLWTLASLLACAGSGATSGERTPGGSTSLGPSGFATRDDAGNLVVNGPGDASVAVYTDGGTYNPAAARLGHIAVDGRDETSYVVQGFPRRALFKEIDGGVTVEGLGVRTLYAVRADGGLRSILELDGYWGEVMHFPVNSVLLVAHRGDYSSSCSTLVARWPIGAEGPPQSRTLESCFGIGALSPSRRWLTTFTASSSGGTRILGLLDPTTFTVARLPDTATDDETVTATWMNGRDGLVTLTRSDPPRDDVVRFGVHQWDLRGVTSAQVSSHRVPTPHEASVYFEVNARLRVAPGNPQVSPDNRVVVLSSREGPIISFFNPPPTKAMRVVDLERRESWEMEGLLGPVAFTPDDSTIVAWRDDARARAQLPDGGSVYADSALVFVDRRTRARTELPLPVAGPPLFFVTRTGHRVLVSSAGGHELVIYDMQMRRFSGASADATDVSNFVSRAGGGELWLANRGLWRVSVLDDLVERVDPGWQPDQINHLPYRDLLVLDRPFENALTFWNPVTRRTVATVQLPVPAPR